MKSRRLIIEDKVRPDGRAIDEIRPLNSQVDLMPRVHGSAMFTRGETQVISSTTLGALNENQIIDDVTEVDKQALYASLQLPALLRRRNRTHRVLQDAVKSVMVP